MNDQRDDKAPKEDGKRQELDLLTSCVHCGFCLDACPTFQITGDENNSPRGRLRLWRAEVEGRLPADEWTDHYTSQCVGCLACQPACPANVPYGEILERTRARHQREGRLKTRWSIRTAAAIAKRPRLMGSLMLPGRLMRRTGISPHRLLFAGSPSIKESSARYAERLMREKRPTGPRVALFVGCLMESLFREINFATIRVLIAHNVQVVVPKGQTCCGALHAHAGLPDVDTLWEQNTRAFDDSGYDAIVCNSSGCGLELSKALSSQPVRDVLDFLGEIGPRTVERGQTTAKVYVDLPCHLVHGQRKMIPINVLDAMGYEWELAPMAEQCCGAGGAYNVQNPESARAILARKAAFLDDAAGEPLILATANHVCMMQWNAAKCWGVTSRTFEVRHVIQLLEK